MNVELGPDLERRLRQAAQRCSKSVPELVEEALTAFLDTLSDEPVSSVRATQSLLPRVWAAEDFSDWRPPDGG